MQTPYKYTLNKREKQNPAQITWKCSHQQASEVRLPRVLRSSSEVWGQNAEIKSSGNILDAHLLGQCGVTHP